MKLEHLQILKPLSLIAVMTVLVRLLVRYLENVTNRVQNDAFIVNSTYRIYFNFAERISFKTPLHLAQIVLREGAIELTGDTITSIPYSEIESLRLESPHSKAMRATVVEIKFRPGKVIYFGVLRYAFFKTFVINNLFKTLEMFQQIRQKVPSDRCWSVFDKPKSKRKPRSAKEAPNARARI